MNPVKVLVADDEPLLRDALVALLDAHWPGARAVVLARNGREALELFEAHRPDICFLDIQMPGLNGIEVARAVGSRAHVVFVTAFDHFAVQAFDQGAVDYLVKPLQPQRFAIAVQRLRQRLLERQPAPFPQALLERLAGQLAARPGEGGYLRWLRAGVGQTVRLVPVADVQYFKAEAKYTVVAWRDEAGQPVEAVVRASLRSLLAQLDPGVFQQVHRGVVVNLGAVSHVTRGDGDTATLHLKARAGTLPVSRAWLHLFKPE